MDRVEADFRKRDREDYEWECRQPVCKCCEEPSQHAYSDIPDIGVICERCFKEYFHYCE